MTPVVAVLRYYFSNPSQEQDVIKTRLVNYLLFSVGLLPYYLLPIWAGLFEDSYGFGGTEIGLLLAADMTGGTIAAAAARFWITRTKWRTVMVLSLLSGFAVNVACAFVGAFDSLLILRSAAGLAAGTFMAVVYADFAHESNPDREFSIALALQVMMGALSIGFAPQILETWGSASLFVLVGLLCLLPFVLLNAWPERRVASRSEVQISGPVTTFRVWLGLATICLFFLSLTCVWVAMERLATANGMDAPLVAAVLSTGLLFSFLGAAAPAFTATLAARRWQINVSYVALVAGIVVIGNNPAIWLFAGGLAVYNFFFSFVIPFQTAWVAETDNTGVNAVLIPLAQGVGVSIGPAIGGWLLGTGNYLGVMHVSIAVLIGAWICAHFAGDPIRR